MINVVEYVFFRSLSVLAGFLSYRANAAVGSFLGWFSFHFLRIRRRVTLDNLRHAFPEKSESERNRIAEGAFRNYGIAILQMLWASSSPDDDLKRAVRLPDRLVLDKILSSKKGFIMLGAHFGGWEFTLHGLVLHVGRPTSSIVQRQRNTYVNDFVDKVRRRHGNQTIVKGMIREALRVLQSGGILTVLGDQSGPRESLYVNFFGRPAATYRGVAAFSIKTDCPILFFALIRGQDGFYDTLFEEVDKSGLPAQTEHAIFELTRRHVAVLERYIRKYPDQWLWMHKRWKHKEAIQEKPQEGNGE